MRFDLPAHEIPDWSYEPSDDVDGDPRFDATVGIDHFVMEGSEEIASPPGEVRARLIAAAPALYRAVLAGMKAMEIKIKRKKGRCNGYEYDFMKLARAAIDKATGNNP